LNYLFFPLPSLTASLRTSIFVPPWLLLVGIPFLLSLQPSTDRKIAEQLRTPITDLFNINHPIMLAGMNVAAGPKLAAAVTNAGGLGVIGGVGYTPEMLREQIADLKGFLNDKSAPFGVDLLLPQVGGNARKTKFEAPQILKKMTCFLRSTLYSTNMCSATITPRES
jgi:Nitronate monooxygenase